MRRPLVHLAVTKTATLNPTGRVMCPQCGHSKVHRYLGADFLPITAFELPRGSPVMPSPNQTDAPKTGPQAAYEAHLAAGRFVIQRSKSTGEYVFWPRGVAESGAVDLEWVAAKGTGFVYAITVTRTRSGSSNVALIELDEGVRLMSTLPDVETAPIGARVQARIEQAEAGPRVVFDLLEGDAA